MPGLSRTTNAPIDRTLAVELDARPERVGILTFTMAGAATGGAAPIYIIHNNYENNKSKNK